MKILHVCFENLNSLRGKFEIDFAKGKLAEAGIFAITGPTGSGKTTILDAITLALFGRAARYDKEVNPESMMSRGTGSCFSEVLFSCGAGEYRVRWNLRRAHNNPDGNIQQAEMQISTREGEILKSKVKNVREKIVELTGMDYPRFLRSVLLAQGRFKEFLEAKESERGDLLEKITGTELYSGISRTAYAVAKEKEDEIKDASISLQGIELLSDEEIQELTEARDTAKKGIAEKDVSLKTNKQKTELFEKHKNLSEKIDGFKKEEERILKKKEAFSHKQNRLNLHDKAVPLSGDLKLFEGAKLQRDKFAHQVKDVSGSESTLKQKLHQGYFTASKSCENQRLEALVSLKAKSDEESRLKTEIEKIKNFLKENKKDAEVEEKLPLFRKGAEELGQKESHIANLQKHIQKLKQSLNKGIEEAQILAKKQLKQQELYQGKSSEFDQQKSLFHDKCEGKSIEGWSLELEALREKHEQLKELFRDSEAWNKNQSEQKCLEKETVALEAKIKLLSSEQDNLEKQLKLEEELQESRQLSYQQSIVLSSLEEHRKNLKAEEECPLCGSLEHPFARKELPSESELKSQFNEQKLKVQKLRDNTNKSKGELIRIRESLEGKRKIKSSLVGLEAELKASFEAKKILDDTTEIGELEEFKNRVLEVQKDLLKLNTFIQELNKAEEHFNNLEKDLLKLKAELEKLNGQSAEQKQGIEKSKKELLGLEADRDSLEKVLNASLAEFSELLASWVDRVKSLEDVRFAVQQLEARAKFYRDQKSLSDKKDQELQTLSLEQKQIDAVLQKLTEELDAWKSKLGHFEELNVLNVSLETEQLRRDFCDKTKEAYRNILNQKDSLNKQLNDESKKLMSLEENLQNALKERGFETIDSLKSSLLAEGSYRQLKEEKEKLETEFTGNHSLLQQSQKDLKEMDPEDIVDEGSYLELKNKNEEIEADKKKLSESIGAIQNQFASDKKAKEEQKDQVEKIQKLEDEAKPWRVLNDLIGQADGSKFSKFAQGLTLAQLVILANKQLKSLNPRYEINRVEGSDLDLEIVDLYQGDTRRPTKSLSGGESFLVSLALALGLAELAGRNTKIESLFIDEGFGSLDADTLDIALSALDNLRMDNRSIGIISHVEALKQQLSTQIQVIRQNNGTSRIEIIESV